MDRAGLGGKRKGQVVLDPLRIDLDQMIRFAPDVSPAIAIAGTRILDGHLVRRVVDYGAAALEAGMSQLEKLPATGETNFACFGIFVAIGQRPAAAFEPVE